MGNRRPSAEHQEAVSRRLRQLSAELAGVRGGLDAPTVPRPSHDEGDYAMPLTHTRISRPRPQPAVAPIEPVPWTADDQMADEFDEPAPLVPRPGRHASRRVGRVPDVVPATLRGRVALGPAQLAFVAGLVAVGLAVTCWWIIRGDPHEVAAPAVASPPAGLATPVEPAPGGTTPAGSTPDSPAAAGGEVTVDVAGKVRRPGIVVLEAGARVIDAVEAAGGARPKVDLSTLNLARLLVDGEQILVGTPVAVGAAGAATPVAPGTVDGPLVNLNTADQVQLETLPDVGPVTAQAIIAWRTENGGFTAVEELLEVDGIGDATLATISPHVTV